MKKPDYPSRPAFSRAADMLTGWRKQQQAALDEEQRQSYQYLEQDLEYERSDHQKWYFWARDERASREASKLMQEKPVPQLRMFPPQRMKMYQALQLGRGMVDRRHYAEARAMAEDHQKALDNYLRKHERQRRAAKAADRSREEFKQRADAPSPARDARNQQHSHERQAGQEHRAQKMSGREQTGPIRSQPAPEKNDQNRREFNAKAEARSKQDRETRDNQTRDTGPQRQAPNVADREQRNSEQQSRPAPDLKDRAKEGFNASADRSSANDQHRDQEPQPNHDAPAPGQASGHDQPQHPSPGPHVPEITQSLADRFNARADIGYGHERGYGHNPDGFDHGAHGPGGH